MSKKKRPFFSVIIPYLQESSRVENMLKSIIAQNEDVEIIVVNNCESQDELSKTYPSVRVINMNDETSCLSNAYNAGLRDARGEWVTFAQPDDVFTLDSFRKIREYMKNENINTYCFSNLFEVNAGVDFSTMTIEQLVAKENDIIREENEARENNTTFEGKHYITRTFTDINDVMDTLNGKFFNVDNCIKRFDLSFIEDLTSNADLYFVRNALMQLQHADGDSNMNIAQIVTYLRTSRADDIEYTFTHLNEFLVASSRPYFDIISRVAQMNNERDEKERVENILESDELKSFLPIARERAMLDMLITYFYVQNYESKNGKTSTSYEMRYYTSTFKQNMMNMLGLSDVEIINVVYQNANVYFATFNRVITRVGTFIPRTSFADFILNI